MCRRIQCSTCGKPSFAGCGAHVEQVLGDVPKADRCRCAEEKQQAKQASSSSSGESKSFWEKLFGS